MHFVTTLLNVRNKKSHEWVTSVLFSTGKVGKKRTPKPELKSRNFSLLWIYFSLGLTSNLIRKGYCLLCLLIMNLVWHDFSNVWWGLFLYTSAEPILSSPNWQNELWSVGGGVRMKKWQSGQPRGCGGLLLSLQLTQQTPSPCAFQEPCICTLNIIHTSAFRKMKKWQSRQPRGCGGLLLREESLPKTYTTNPTPCKYQDQGMRFLQDGSQSIVFSLAQKLTAP